MYTFESLVLKVEQSGLQRGAKKGAQKLKTKFFTKAEMLDMKPSEFKTIMESRTDIPEIIR